MENRNDEDMRARVQALRGTAAERHRAMSAERRQELLQKGRKSLERRRQHQHTPQGANDSSLTNDSANDSSLLSAASPVATTGQPTHVVGLHEVRPLVPTSHHQQQHAPGSAAATPDRSAITMASEIASAAEGTPYSDYSRAGASCAADDVSPHQPPAHSDRTDDDEDDRDEVIQNQSRVIAELEGELRIARKSLEIMREEPHGSTPDHPNHRGSSDYAAHHGGAGGGNSPNSSLRGDYVEPSSNAQLVALRAQLEYVTMEAQGKEQQLLELRAKVNEEEKENMALCSRINQLQETLKIRDDEVADLTTARSATPAVVASAAVDHTSGKAFPLDATVNGSPGRVDIERSGLDEELHVLAREKLDLEQDNEKQAAIIEQLQTQWSQLAKDVRVNEAKLESENQTLRGELAHMKEAHQSEMKAQHAQLQQYYADAWEKAQVQYSESMALQLQQQQATLDAKHQTNIEELTNEFNEKTKVFHEAADDDKVRQEVDEAVSAAIDRVGGEFEQKFAEERQKWEEELCGARATIQALEARVADLTARDAEMAARISELTTTVEDDESELQAAHAAAAEAQNRLRAELDSSYEMATEERLAQLQEEHQQELDRLAEETQALVAQHCAELAQRREIVSAEVRAELEAAFAEVRTELEAAFATERTTLVAKLAQQQQLFEEEERERAKSATSASTHHHRGAQTQQRHTISVATHSPTKTAAGSEDANPTLVDSGAAAATEASTPTKKRNQRNKKPAKKHLQEESPTTSDSRGVVDADAVAALHAQIADLTARDAELTARISELTTTVEDDESELQAAHAAAAEAQNRLRAELESSYEMATEERFAQLQEEQQQELDRLAEENEDLKARHVLEVSQFEVQAAAAAESRKQQEERDRVNLLKHRGVQTHQRHTISVATHSPSSPDPQSRGVQTQQRHSISVATHSPSKQPSDEVAEVSLAVSCAPDVASSVPAKQRQAKSTPSQGKETTTVTEKKPRNKNKKQSSKKAPKGQAEEVEEQQRVHGTPAAPAASAGPPHKSSDSELEHLRQQLADSVSEVSTLQARVADLTTRDAEMAARISELTTTVEDDESELQAAQAAAAEAQNRLRAELESSYEMATEERLAQLQEEHQQELDRLADQSERLRDSLAAKHAEEAAQLRSTLSSEIASDFERRFAAEREQLENTVTAASDAKTQSTASALEAQIAQLEADVSSHPAQLRAAEENAEKQLNALREDHLHLKDEQQARFAEERAELLSQQQTEVSTALADLRSELESGFETERTEIKAYYADAWEKAQVQYSESMAQQLQQQQATLDAKHQANIEELEKRIEELCRENVAAETATSSALNSVDATAAVASSNRELEVAQQRIKQLESSALAAQENLVAAHQKELEAAQSLALEQQNTLSGELNQHRADSETNLRGLSCELQRVKDANTEEHSRLTAENETLASHLKESNHKLSQLQTQLASLQSHSGADTLRCGELESALAAAKTESAQLAKEAEDLRDELSRKSSIIREQDISLSHVSDSGGGGADSSAMSYGQEERMIELESRLRQYGAERDDALVDVDRLTLELASSEKAVEARNSTIRRSQQDMHNLKTTLAASKAECSRAMAELQEAQRQCFDLRTRVDVFEERQSDIEAENDDCREDLLVARSSLTMFAEYAREALSILRDSALFSDVAAPLASSFTDLLQELANLKESHEALRTEHQDLVMTHEVTMETLTEATLHRDTLLQLTKDHEDTQVRLRETTASLDADLTSVKNEAARAQAEQASSKVALTSKVASLEANMGALESALAASKSHLAQEQERSERLRDDAHSSERQQRQRHDEQLKEVQAASDELAAKLRSTQKELRESVIRIDDATADIAKLESKNESLSGEVDGAAMRSSELEEQLSQKSSEITTLKGHLAEAGDKTEELYHKINSLTARKKEVEASLSEVHDELKEVSSNMSALQASHAKQSQELLISESKITTLEENVNVIRAKQRQTAESYEQQAEELECTRARLQRDASSVRAENVSLLEQVRELEARVTEAEKKHVDTHEDTIARCQRLEDENSSLQKRQSEASARADKLGKNLNKAESARNAAESSNKELLAELRKAKEEKTNLERDGQADQQRATRLDQALAKAKRSFEETETTHLNDVERLSKEANSHKQVLRETAAELEDVRTVNASLTAQLEGKISELSSVRQQHAQESESQEKLIREKQHEIATLTTKSQHLADDLDVRSEEVAALSAKNVSLNTSLGRAKAHLQEREDALEASAESTKKEKDESMRKLEETKRELADANAKLRDVSYDLELKTEALSSAEQKLASVSTSFHAREEGFLAECRDLAAANHIAENALASLKASNQSLEGRLVSEKASHDAVLADHSQCSSRILAAEATIKQLRQSLAEREAEAESMKNTQEEQIELMQQRATDTRRDDLTALERVVQTERQSVEDLRAAKDKIGQRCATVERDRTKLEAHVDELNSEVRRQKKRNDELLRARAETVEQIRAAAAQIGLPEDTSLTQLFEDVITKLHAIDDAKQHVASEKERLDELEGLLQQLEAKGTTVTTAVHGSQNHLRRLADQLKRHKPSRDAAHEHARYRVSKAALVHTQNQSIGVEKCVRSSASFVQSMSVHVRALRDEIYEVELSLASSVAGHGDTSMVPSKISDSVHQQRLFVSHVTRILYSHTMRQMRTLSTVSDAILSWENAAAAGGVDGLVTLPSRNEMLSEMSDVECAHRTRPLVADIHHVMRVFEEGEHFSDLTLDMIAATTATAATGSSSSRAASHMATPRRDTGSARGGGGVSVAGVPPFSGGLHSHLSGERGGQYSSARRAMPTEEDLEIGITVDDTIDDDDDADVMIDGTEGTEEVGADVNEFIKNSRKYQKLRKENKRLYNLVRNLTTKLKDASISTSISGVVAAAAAQSGAAGASGGSATASATGVASSSHAALSAAVVAAASRPLSAPSARGDTSIEREQRRTAAARAPGEDSESIDEDNGDDVEDDESTPSPVRRQLNALGDVDDDDVDDDASPEARDVHQW